MVKSDLFQLYQKIRSRYLRELLERASDIKLDCTFQREQFGIRCHDPFWADKSEASNRPITRITLSRKLLFDIQPNLAATMEVRHEWIYWPLRPIRPEEVPYQAREYFRPLML
jgi:hypothetical protein